MTRALVVFIAIVPWLADLFFGKSVMASMLGNVLWGLALLLSFLLTRLRDPKLRKSLSYLLVFLAGAWVSLLVTLLYHNYDFTWNPKGLYWITVGHGSLLAAGFGGMVLVFCLSLLWIFKDLSLRSSSARGLKLPSLESLSRAVNVSLNFAGLSWGFGLFFALVSAGLKWRSEHAGELSQHWAYDWLRDQEVMGSFVLWFLILLLSLGFRRFFQEANPLRYKFFMIVSCIFVVLFVFTVSQAGSGRHGDIDWFVR
jgi:hypothetical protein